MTAIHDRRSLHETPFRREAQSRLDQRMERQATMPKSLPELLRWFEEEVKQETPDALHSGTVWRDHVGEWETDKVGAPLKPVGSSDTGALGYNADFRKVLEGSPSQVDKRDPENTGSGRAYFFRPIAAALSRMGRNGHPLMARHLMLLMAASFDWRIRANKIGWAHEEYEVYIREALICLWRGHREWVRSD